MQKSFGGRLEHLRGERSQREFARQIGVPLNTYTNWVREIRTPTIDALKGICTQLNVSADWLLGLPGASAPAVPSVPSVSSVPPDAASAPSEAYWRGLAASQQETIAGLTRLLSAAAKPTSCARAGGRAATKTA